MLNYPDPPEDSPVPSAIAKGGPSGNANALKPPNNLGRLVVQVFFHQEPVQEVPVSFFKEDRTPLNVLPIVTDENGLAEYDTAVPVGNYLCGLGYQPDITISTVEDAAKPIPIVLPVGRPMFDVGGNWEFDRS